MIHHRENSIVNFLYDHIPAIRNNIPISITKDMFPEIIQATHQHQQLKEHCPVIIPLLLRDIKEVVMKGDSYGIKECHVMHLMDLSIDASDRKHGIIPQWCLAREILASHASIYCGKKDASDEIRDKTLLMTGKLEESMKRMDKGEAEICNFIALSLPSFPFEYEYTSYNSLSIIDIKKQASKNIPIYIDDVDGLIDRIGNITNEDTGRNLLLNNYVSNLRIKECDSRSSSMSIIKYMNNDDKYIANGVLAKSLIQDKAIDCLSGMEPLLIDMMLGKSSVVASAIRTHTAQSLYNVTSTVLASKNTVSENAHDLIKDMNNIMKIQSVDYNNIYGEMQKMDTSHPCIPHHENKDIQKNLMDMYVKINARTMNEFQSDHQNIALVIHECIYDSYGRDEGIRICVDDIVTRISKGLYKIKSLISDKDRISIRPGKDKIPLFFYSENNMSKPCASDVFHPMRINQHGRIVSMHTDVDIHAWIVNKDNAIMPMMDALSIVGLQSDRGRHMKAHMEDTYGQGIWAALLPSLVDEMMHDSKINNPNNMKRIARIISWASDQGR